MEMVSINFDSNDRIRRIGSIQMSYNRFALERVGEYYNRRGQVVDIYGSVKAVEGMHITKTTIIYLRQEVKQR
jgi:fructose-1,6-bisphosphatase/inositol monophosphatase family enzyme